MGQSSDSEEDKRKSRSRSRSRSKDDVRRKRHDSSDSGNEGKRSPKRREGSRSPDPAERKRSKSRSKSKPRLSPEKSKRRDERSRSRERRRSKSRSRERRKSRSRSRDRRRSRSGSRDKRREADERKRPGNVQGSEKEKTSAPARKKEDLLTTKTGGAYIPPAKLRMMQKNITDKSSEAYQRLAWEALKKSINGLINKVNSPNIAVIVRELFAENIVRGRGLLCQSIIQAQTASPTFTHVYAALAAIINTKFPNIGELLLKRLILNFKRGFKRNDKTRCTSSVRFIGHMVNQQVAHEVLSLEILTLLLENPTDDSAEVAITFLKEVGQKLSEVSPRGIHAIFERLRHVLHESTLDKRTQYMIEVMFQVRKDGFKDNPSIAEELDLVEEDDQFTHMITLDDATGGEEILNVFKHDADYEENEQKYGAIKSELLGDDSGGSSGSDGGSGSGSSSDDSDDEQEEKKDTIIDATETNLISLRRTIYLTIQSSLDFEESVHKLNKLNIKPGQEQELCHMIIDCCAQQRTYEKFFGLMGQRFCQVNKMYVEPFMKIFVDTYNTVHRLETGKLRNVAKFFSHLLHTDAIGWEVFQVIKLNEDDTTSSSRIFIKLLFQELAEFLGMTKLVERTRDATMAPAWEGIMPRDNPRDTRFAINFFTSIGLGALTEDLRAHLKNAPKPTAIVAPMVRGEKGESSSSSSSDSSSSDSDSESSDSEEEDRRKKRDKKKKKKKSGDKWVKRERSDSRDERSNRKKRQKSVDDKRGRKRDNDSRKKRHNSVSSSSEERVPRKKAKDFFIKQEEDNRVRRKEYEREDSRDRNGRRRERSADRRDKYDRKRDRSESAPRRRERDRSASAPRRRDRDRSASGGRRRDRERSGSAPRRRRERSVSPGDRRQRHR